MRWPCLILLRFLSQHILSPHCITSSMKDMLGAYSHLAQLCSRLSADVPGVGLSLCSYAQDVCKGLSNSRSWRDLHLTSQRSYQGFIIMRQPHTRKSLRAPGVVPQFTMQSAPPVLTAAPWGAAAGALAARVVPVAAAGAVATPAGMFSVCVPAAAPAGAADTAVVGPAASAVAAAGAITREGAWPVTGSCTVAAAGAAALSTGADVATGWAGAAAGAGAAWVGAAAAKAGTCCTTAGCCTGAAAMGCLTGGTARVRATGAAIGAAAGACKQNYSIKSNNFRIVSKTMCRLHHETETQPA